MGVPGLRLCLDIVADGVEQLHPATKAPVPHPPGDARVPWVCGLNEVVCVCVGAWVRGGGVCVSV